MFYMCSSAKVITVIQGQQQ